MRADYVIMLHRGYGFFFCVAPLFVLIKLCVCFLPLMLMEADFSCPKKVVVDSMLRER